VVSATPVAMQRCGKHISAAMNQHATIEEAEFSAGAGRRLYDEDLRQLELQLRKSLQAAVEDDGEVESCALQR
jgi:hypothetical protein